MSSTATAHRWMALVPGVTLGSRMWIVRVAAVFFYLYLAVVVVGWSKIKSGTAAPADLTTAVGILLGLVVLYVASVLPVVLSDHRRGQLIVDAVHRFQAHRLAVVGCALFLFLTFLSFLAPVLSPYEPFAQDAGVESRYQSPSLDHPMGTDRLGRDILSRLLFGARVSLAVGFIAVLLASLVGMVLGAFSGYVGGRTDDVAMRVVDGLLSFPRLLLLLTLLAFFSNSLTLVVLVLAATGWMGVARIVRTEVISLRQQDFIHAAVAAGTQRWQVVTKHLLPNTLGTVVVAATLRVGTVILLESYLSFLGLGIQPPAASWGNMVFDGRDVLLSAWWVSAFPGLAIVTAVVSFNLLGDGLRDAIDVKSQ